MSIVDKTIIPEREAIYQLLESHSRAVGLDELLSIFNIDKRTAKFFSRRLQKMVEARQLRVDQHGAYSLGNPTQFLSATIEQGAEGLAARCRDGRLLTLPSRLASRVFVSDKVRLGLVQSPAELEPEPSVVSLQVSQRDYEVVGTFLPATQQLAPLNQSISVIDIVQHDSARRIKAGEAVVARLLPTCRPAKPQGEIVEVLEFRARSGLEVESAIRSFGLPHSGSRPLATELAQCQTRSAAIIAEPDREDLTTLPFVTIDGADAKDFDDAIFCSQDGTQTSAWVAIADVASYVKVGSALDQEALLRGNSVYFPGRVVPMLPPALSDDLCSLRPEQNRPVLVCRMEFAAGGQMKEYRFFKAVIRSRKRLTYHEANVFMTDASVPHTASLKGCGSEIKTMLRVAHQLYLALKKLRTARGALDLDLVETQLLFDGNQNIKAIVPLVRNDAHRLIEELMISANIAAAHFLLSRKQCFLHRVHQGVKPDARVLLTNFLNDRGLHLSGTTSKDFAQLIRDIAGHPHQHIIQNAILRALNRALYSALPTSHFGLALKHYTHFTSPIRRYPDLSVHRVIHHLLGSASGYCYSEAEIKYQGEYCSMTERRADEAVRDVEQYLHCVYAQNYLGKACAGVVTAVTAFGLFIELDELYVTGLLHVTALGRDYYRFDKSHECLVGERSGETFRLGDKLIVKIVRVVAEQRKIDLVKH